MKKLVLSAVTVVAFLAYALLQRGGTLPGSAATSGTSSGTGTPTTVAGTTGNAGASGNSASGTTVYKDGSYTGSAEDAFYGTVQVKAVIQSNRISQVQFLQYPQDRRRSLEINQQAMPVLQQEAVQAQSADVQLVTGATLTSQAFVKSLQSALTQAGS